LLTVLILHMQHISRPTERAGHYVSSRSSKGTGKQRKSLRFRLAFLKRKCTCGYDQMRLHQVSHAYLIDPSKVNDVIMKHNSARGANAVGKFTPLVNFQGVYT
jgi:hypothetical protein